MKAGRADVKDYNLPQRMRRWAVGTGFGSEELDLIQMLVYRGCLGIFMPEEESRAQPSCDLGL